MLAPFRISPEKRSSAHLGRGACLGKLRAMLNRRKAMIGYLAYTIAKPIAMHAMKRKAKAAAKKDAGSRINTKAIVAGAGAVLGGLLFWRNRRGRDEESHPSDEKSHSS